MEFRDKRAVIIGGAAGIGRSIVRGLAEAGANVFIGDIDSDGAARTAAELRQLGVAADFGACDISSDKSVAAFAQRAFAGGRVDLLFNHAGASLGGLLEAVESDDWTWLLNINIVGLGRSIRSFLPKMTEQGSGWIVNTSSGLGLFHDLPIAAPYIATKAAIIAYSRALATYVRNRGIGVSVFCPDLTATAFVGSGRLVGIAPDLMPAFLTISEVQSPDDAAVCLLDGLRQDNFLISAVPRTAERLTAMAGDLLRPGSDRNPGAPPTVQIASMRVPAERLDEAWGALTDFAVIARKHVGCLVYEPGADPAKRGLLKVFEVWSDIEALDAHSLSPDALAFMARMFALGAHDFSLQRPAA